MAHHVRAHHQATKQPNEDDMNVQVMECESLLNCIKPSKKRSTYKSTNDTPYALKEGVKKSIKSKSLKSSKGVKDQSDSVIIEESAEQLRLSPPFESSSIYQIVEEQMKTGAGIETEGKLLEVMSELFTKDCDMLFQNGDTIPGMQLDMAADHLDHGLFFLAASSDDVTDAEMESLAQFGQNLAASTSKETTATCSIDTSVVP